MTPLDSAIYSGLYADPEIAALFHDKAEIAAMIAFESALARVQARLGVIPDDGGRLADAIAAATIDPVQLNNGVAKSGIPVPALVTELRDQIGEGSQFLHWGATTHDVMDTALILRLRDALSLMEQRLGAIIDRLAALADKHRRTPMAARTWLQHATPTSFGLKCAIWLDPLLRQRTRLAEIRPRVLAVQSGGASGTLAAVTLGIETNHALAAELSLSPAMPWHVSRDRILEIAGWLATTTATLGKIGADLILLVQTELAEVKLGSTGASSTMPQKQNPVGPSALVALARTNSSAIGEVHHAALQVHERDLAHWSAEWLALPRMICATGASLKIAQETLETLHPNPQTMRQNLDASNGSILAEALSFALANHMPRDAAQALVKASAQRVAATGANLIDEVRTQTDAPIDWSQFKDPANHIGQADSIITHILNQAS